MSWFKKKLTAKERCLREFPIPENKLERFFELWDADRGSALGKYRLWEYVAEIFPELEDTLKSTNDNWHLRKFTLGAVLREGCGSDWED